MEEKQGITEATILKERAKKLARSGKAEADEDNGISMVCFRLTNEYYCLESNYIGEIVSLSQLTRIPAVPLFIEGLINVRGQIVPLLNLKHILGLAVGEKDRSNKVLLLRDRNLGKEFGILADQILGAIKISDDEIHPTPQNTSGSGREFIKGVCSDGKIVLYATRLLSSASLVINSGK
jgi:purine-binding chemotaxis protein CheW